MSGSHASGRLRPVPPPLRRGRAIAVRGALCGLLVLGASFVAGCAAPAPRPGPSIKLSSAQVTQPSASGVTDIFVDVQNTGPADALIGARISVGGHVTLRSPAQTGVMDMHTVRAIAIPARSLVGLDPNGAHLLVTGAGKMISGREITVTLLFAHAGAISVPAMVTNPATGGASYFLN
jgi:copper(I)-binding protein